MSIRTVAAPGRPATGRRYDSAETSRRHREKLRSRGIVELRGLRLEKSELAVIDQLVDALGYATRAEMLVCELMKLGQANGIRPVRGGV